MYFDVGVPFRSNRDATSNPRESSHRFDFTMNQSRPREESVEGILTVNTFGQQWFKYPERIHGTGILAYIDS